MVTCYEDRTKSYLRVLNCCLQEERNIKEHEIDGLKERCLIEDSTGRGE